MLEDDFVRKTFSASSSMTDTNTANFLVSAEPCVYADELGRNDV